MHGNGGAGRDMTALEAVIDLLERVGTCQGATVLLNEKDLREWPTEAVTAMKAQRLLVKARPATSAVCPGCECDCVMPVQTLTTATGTPVFFIVCDKRNDTNRVSVSADTLPQWKCSADLVCGFIAASLGLRSDGRKTLNADLWEIGMATGRKRSQMLCLQADGMVILIVGGNNVLLADMIEFRNGQYGLDLPMIQRMVDASTTADNRYTPTIVKREARKLETNKLHSAWKKEYRKLKRDHPDKPDTWYAQKIFKLPIAHGRSSETIRKNMK